MRVRLSTEEAERLRHRWLGGRKGLRVVVALSAFVWAGVLSVTFWGTRDPSWLLYMDCTSFVVGSVAVWASWVIARRCRLDLEGRSLTTDVPGLGTAWIRLPREDGDRWTVALWRTGSMFDIARMVHQPTVRHEVLHVAMLDLLHRTVPNIETLPTGALKQIVDAIDVKATAIEIAATDEGSQE